MSVFVKMKFVMLLLVAEAVRNFVDFTHCLIHDSYRYIIQRR